jgi:hypothetical protein
LPSKSIPKTIGDAKFEAVVVTKRSSSDLAFVAVVAVVQAETVATAAVVTVNE